MNPTSETRIPQSGEILILSDGRQFVLAIGGEAESTRGWSFSATARSAKGR
jgi:hypothetical protein